MKLENEFTLDVPIAKAWICLRDLGRVAPCLPGATMEEAGQDAVEGTVNLKVGAMSIAYFGSVEVLESDEAAGTIVMRARGRERGGQGSVKATIRADLSERDGSTAVVLATDLALTGRVAQFGRGIIAEISSRLLDEFAQNLERDVLRDASPRADDTPPRPLGDGPSANAAVDLLHLARGPILRRMTWAGAAAGGLVLAWLLAGQLRR